VLPPTSSVLHWIDTAMGDAHPFEGFHSGDPIAILRPARAIAHARAYVDEGGGARVTTCPATRRLRRPGPHHRAASFSADGDRLALVARRHIDIVDVDAPTERVRIDLAPVLPRVRSAQRAPVDP
jgi:hypothetical protein